jgi:hypothetical protein
VFGVRSTLIADWLRHEPGIAPDGTRTEVPFSTLDFDFALKTIIPRISNRDARGWFAHCGYPLN